MTRARVVEEPKISISPHSQQFGSSAITTYIVQITHHLKRNVFVN